MFESALFIVTGASLYGGAHHLYHGVHNRAGHPHVIHAVMFFLLAGFALFSASTGDARSVAELSRSGKLAVSLGMLLFAALPWFIALLLQQQSRILPALLACAWSALLLVNIASPYSLLYQDITALNQILPSGLTSVALHTAANPVWHLVEISMLGTLMYSLYLCVQQYRKAGEFIAIVPAAGLLLLLCTTVFDFFVHAGLTHSAYLAPMGFLLFLIATGLHRQPVPVVASRRSAETSSNNYQVTMNINQAPVRNHQTAPIVGEQVNETAAPPSAQIDHQQSEPPFPFFAHEKFKPVTVSAPAIEARSTVAVTVPESESELPRHDAGEVAAVTQVRIDNPTVDKVSDGLVDIAVHATLILKRLERGDLDPQELEELSRKVRARAIETRRITNQMLRAEQVESPQKAD